VYGLWNARFLLQLSAIHFKFPLSAIFLSDEKDVLLMVKYCNIHQLKVNMVHAAENIIYFGSSKRISPFGLLSLVESYISYGGRK
jgi:hypothetical protein